MGRVVGVLAEKKRARDEREAVLGAFEDSDSDDEEEVKAVDKEEVTAADKYKEGVTAANKSEAPENTKPATARSSPGLKGVKRKVMHHRLVSNISSLVQKNDTIIEEDSDENEDGPTAEPRQREISEIGPPSLALGGPFG